MKINPVKYELFLATKCLSVKELSEICSISTVTLGKIRNGSEARPQTIGRLAAALGVDVTDLIED